MMASTKGRVRAGQLRHRVVINQATYTRNTTGERIASTPTTTTVWAAIERIAGNEKYEANRVVIESTHLITIRYFAGLSTEDTITWNGKTYEIVAMPDFDELHHMQALECKESV